MNLFFHQRKCVLAIFILAPALAGCAVETAAYGTVKDAKTGLPVAGAHVVEIALSNKSEHFLGETLTDTLGNFSLDLGPQHFGAHKVKLQVIVEKDSFATTIQENNYAGLNISIFHY